MKTWLNVAEGAEYAGVSRDTIYTGCERRELRHARVAGRRAIRLKREWIDAWLEQHAQGALLVASPIVTPCVASGGALERATRTRAVDSPASGPASRGRS
jgi:excisionase family DNA binding protein